MGIYGDDHYWYCIGIFKFLIPTMYNLDLERKYISRVIYLYNVQFFFSVFLQFNSSLNIAYTVKNKIKIFICRWDPVSFHQYLYGTLHGGMAPVQNLGFFC